MARQSAVEPTITEECWICDAPMVQKRPPELVLSTTKIGPGKKAKKDTAFSKKQLAKIPYKGDQSLRYEAYCS
jgi:hypothetical protein